MRACIVMDANERTAVAVTPLVNQASNDLFANTAFASDENFGIRPCGMIDFLFNTPYGGTDSHQRHCFLHLEPRLNAPARTRWGTSLWALP